MTDDTTPPPEGPDAGERPSGDRASGDRASASGDRPSGDRPSGERASASGDRASGDRASAPPALSPKAALLVALVVTLAVGGAAAFAFRTEQAGTWAMLIALFAAQAPFAALAVRLIAKEGAIATELRPHRGDVSFGCAVALLMYGAAMAGQKLFFAAGTPRSWWVARIYLQLGDTSQNRMIYVGLAVLAIAMMEELVWRGLVMRSLRPSLGPLRAWLLSSVLYGLAHAATIPLLAHPVAGPNPLVVLAAIGGGLVWGHLYNRTGRLGPGLFAHGLFTWAIVDFPLWRPF